MKKTHAETRRRREGKRKIDSSSLLCVQGNRIKFY